MKNIKGTKTLKRVVAVRLLFFVSSSCAYSSVESTAVIQQLEGNTAKLQQRFHKTKENLAFILALKSGKDLGQSPKSFINLLTSIDFLEEILLQSFHYQKDFLLDEI